MTTREDILKMTHAERRDWWVQQPENGGWTYRPECRLWQNQDGVYFLSHSLPDTLDAIADLLPDGWTLTLEWRLDCDDIGEPKQRRYWAATRREAGVTVWVEVGCSERYDRMKLACLALLEDRKEPPDASR